MFSGPSYLAESPLKRKNVFNLLSIISSYAKKNLTDSVHRSTWTAYNRPWSWLNPSDSVVLDLRSHQGRLYMGINNLFLTNSFILKYLYLIVKDVPRSQPLQASTHSEAPGPNHFLAHVKWSSSYIMGMALGFGHSPVTEFKTPIKRRRTRVLIMLTTKLINCH